MDANQGKLADIDDELTFEDPTPLPPRSRRRSARQARAEPAPEAEAGAEAATAATEADAQPAPEPADISTPLPLPAPEPVAAAPAVPAPRNRLAIAAFALALFATVVSVVVTLVASRTLARAAIAIETLDGHDGAEADRAALVAELRGLIARAQPAATQAGPSVPVPAPAALPPTTIDQITNAIDSLRIDLARQREPADVAALEAIRRDQVMLGRKLDAIGERIGRIEGRVTPSRKEGGEGGRARPS